MQNGAYAEIVGHLKENVVLEGINGKFGIIFIAVDHKKIFNDQSYVWHGIYRSNCIPVFLWGQDVLDDFARVLRTLKSNEKLWIVGELEKLDNSLLEVISPYVQLNDLHEPGNLIIGVRDKQRIKKLTVESASVSWLTISGKN